MKEIAELTPQDRSHRMNYRNAYFAESPECIQLGIDYATVKKAPGWKFKVQCLEELQNE